MIFKLEFNVQPNNHKDFHHIFKVSKVFLPIYSFLTKLPEAEKEDSTGQKKVVDPT